LIAEVAANEAEKERMIKDKDVTLSEIGDEMSVIKKNCDQTIK
jgi:hypothetical protein